MRKKSSPTARVFSTERQPHTRAVTTQLIIHKYVGHNLKINEYEIKITDSNIII